MHFAQILPGRGLFRALGEKGMHAARFLPARVPLPQQREGRGRGRRAVSAIRTGTRTGRDGRNADGARGAVGAMRVVAEPGRDWRGAATRAELFAQMRKHCRNALLQRFDELLIHFEHLLQIGRRCIFHVITRAGGAGHGELRCQSGGNIVGGNFVPMAGNGKQANRCRTPWLWARDDLGRSAHVGESRRASIHHDAARGYRDHGFKGEHPFARANRICTKCHSNPLSTWSKHHLIVCSGQTPLVSLRATQCALRARVSGMGEPLRVVRCNMGHEGVLRLGGASPTWSPKANSPPARKDRRRKLPFRPSTTRKTEVSREHSPPLRAALTSLALVKIGANEWRCCMRT